MRVFLDKEGRSIIKAGVDLAANTIKTTLGGAGKTAVIFSGGLVGITKDGVTVSRNLILEGDLNIGATIIRNATEKQLQESGDGTTAVTILTQKMLEYGFEAIEANIDQNELKKGLDIGVDLVCKEIEKTAVKVDNDYNKIKNIATISANNDYELGSLISNAFEEIGSDGTLFIEESKTFNTSVKVEKGFRLDRGYISPLLADQATLECELIKPQILLFDGKIDKMNNLIPVLTKMKETKGMEHMHILIICENVEGEALKSLLVNRIKGAINVTCVNSPFFGQFKDYAMEDIAALTGATYISLNKGINDFDLKYWGTCEKVFVTRDQTTIIGGKGNHEEIEKSLNQIETLIKNSDSAVEIEFLKKRRSNLKGTLAVISVGAATEIEMKEKKDRVDDAVRSVEAAISEGVVVGGGVALARCIKALENIPGITSKQKVGVDILKKSLIAPLHQIIKNAGVENFEEVANNILSMDVGFGFNVKTGKIENLLETGVIDAAKVCKSAIKNAGSVSGTILMSESLIC